MDSRRTYKRLQLELSEEDQHQIKALLRTGYEPARVLRRATILSLLDKGESVRTVSRLLDVSPTTVRTIGRRYNDGGLKKAIYDKASL